MVITHTFLLQISEVRGTETTTEVDRLRGYYRLHIAQKLTAMYRGFLSPLTEVSAGCPEEGHRN